MKVLPTSPLGDALRELLSFLALLLLCWCCHPAAAQLDYAEVERFGNACPRLDSCAHLRSAGRRQLVSIVKERNCACDYLCAEYGDCCIDAPGNQLIKEGDVTGNTSMRCYELRQFGGVYMRDKCPPGYEGPDEARRLCEETRVGDQSDPVGSMPVTDPASGLTYKNIFCSLCHGREPDDVVLWTPRLECPLLTLMNKTSAGRITDEYVLENLATDGKGWGLYLDGDNGSVFFHDCEVDPVMPRLLEGKIRLCRPDLVSECDPQWKGDNASAVRELCRSYAGARYVHGGERGYRNVHCALCNGVLDGGQQLSCQSAEMRGIDIFRQFATHSFALLLDVNERRGQRVGKVRLCEIGEVFDPFFKKCRSLSCLPGYVMRGRKCAPLAPPPAGTEAPAVVVVHADETMANGTIREPPNVTSHEHADLSSHEGGRTVSDLGKFLDCLRISLTDEDYVMLPNRTLFVPKYDRLYEPASYHVSDGSILICTHLDPRDRHEAKFLPLLGHVTVVGLGVSMLFLVLHFCAFCAVPDLRNLSGRNLASQCAALFFAYLCFVAGQFESLQQGACATVGFLTFYFFQVSFFWMAVMAYDVWRTLRMATTELRVSGGRQSKRFCAYSLFTWATPLCVLAALASAEYTDLFPPAYRPGFASRGPPCWFKERRSLLAFFAAPLFAIVLANVALFAASARMIVMTTGQTSAQTHQRRNFKLYLRLALLMGLTWAVGLVAAYADWPVLFYLFVVLNTLQGLFIFMAFTCSSKVVAHLKNKFKLTARPKDFKSSSNSTGSAFSTKPTTLILRH